LSDTEHFGPIDHEMFGEAARRLHSGIDRRTLRTRQALHQALLRLSVERGYDQVSVADIADAANVGRSTFYAHYTDKDDLLRQGLGYLKAMLIDVANDGANPLQFSEFLTEHLREQRQLYQAMMKTGAGSIILTTLRTSLCDIVRSGLRKQRGSAPDEFEVQFVVGAYFAVATWWLDRGARETASAIDEKFQRLAARTLTR
jgi:AcrR family transcriptional regulator